MLGILGVGKMGGAILSGLMKNNLYSKNDILLSLHSEANVIKYKELGYNVTTNVCDLYTNCDTIILAVKPQMFNEVLAEANNYSFKNKLIISIAAGIDINYLENKFKDAYIVRAMPNTPASIGYGVTTYCTNTDNEIINKASDIFNSIGKCYKIREDQMDATLPLNGSMPAYLDYFAKAFIDAAVENNISYEDAKALTLESIISSCMLALNSNESLDTLINNVCSKGGTTIAGLNKLIDNNVDDGIKACFKACMDRSIELKK